MCAGGWLGALSHTPTPRPLTLTPQPTAATLTYFLSCAGRRHHHHTTLSPPRHFPSLLARALDHSFTRRSRRPAGCLALSLLCCQGGTSLCFHCCLCLRVWRNEVFMFFVLVLWSLVCRRGSENTRPKKKKSHQEKGILTRAHSIKSCVDG